MIKVEIRRCSCRRWVISAPEEERHVLDTRINAANPAIVVGTTSKTPYVAMLLRSEQDGERNNYDHQPAETSLHIRTSARSHAGAVIYLLVATMLRSMTTVTTVPMTLSCLREA
jgi:hypothetical protein